MKHKKQNYEADILHNGKAEAAREYIRENAVPLTMVAIGAGLLAAKAANHGANSDLHYTVEQASDKAAENIARARHKTREMSHEASEVVREKGAALTSAVRTHPVIAGLAALTVGVGVAAIAWPNRSHSAAHRTHRD